MKTNNKWLKNWRITLLFSFFILLAGLLTGRLFVLQIVKGNYYSALAVGQSTGNEVSTPPRGDIYFNDNGGSDTFIAATNQKSPFVYADPGEVESATGTLNEITQVVDLEEGKDKQKLLERLKNEQSSYALIARKLSRKQAEQVKNLDLSGVYIKEEYVRYYPGGGVAPHTLGFLGFSGGQRVGQYGVEEYYNNLLAGNGSGKPLAGLFQSTEEPANLHLTIDYGVQFAVEKKLRELQEKLQAKNASAVFMDPSTGEIISMAHIPTFNPNKYNKVDDISIFKNSIVQSSFEFGSVFKPITIASAIDSGAITPQTVYDDTGVVEIGGHKIRNSDGEAHGKQTMTQVLEKSLNTGVVFAQEEAGKKAFKDYLIDFRLDKKTGIDLPGEAGNDVNNIKFTNRDINYATAAFGQGISFTPMRLLSSISAIANKGKIMKPYILENIKQGERTRSMEPEVTAQPISEMTASRVTAMMVSVVENGFGEKAKVPGYKVAGKTGTAQIPKKNSPGYSDETIHTFIGFAPAYDPKFIGMIKVRDPQGIRFSSDSVAPAFGDLTSFLLQYYNIPPQ